MNINRYNSFVAGLLLFHFMILLYLVSTFSISYKEALIFYSETPSILSIITNTSVALFGQNDFALRVPFILFYIGSGILIYLLTQNYFRSQRDRVINLAIFMILPGLNSAALLVNESIIVVFFTLLYLYIYKIKSRACYSLLILFLFIDNSFAILFLALFFYSLKKRDNILLILSLFLFGISMTIYGFDVGGSPKGYLLDTFAKYATIFSPVLFIYFFYSMYRIGLKMPKDIFWYISATALFLSLLFSLRQNIRIEDFAPFVIISVPLMVKLFIHSLRVRLKEFRGVHYFIARFTLLILVINFMFFITNKYLYLAINNPSDHFAHKYHIAKELALELEKRDIQNIKIDDESLALRLKFYQIDDKNTHYYLSKRSYKFNKEKIVIRYNGKTVEDYFIYQLPIKSL